MTAAACHGMDVTIFFPGNEPASQSTAWDQARAVCATCPILEDCLNRALRDEEHHGMWGGKTPRERRTTARRTRRNTPAVCGTVAGYMRHHRLHERACDGCKEANAQHSAKYRGRVA